MDGPVQRQKIVVGALMIGILVFSLVLLQQQFDRGDYRRAVELLSVRQGGTGSINEELLRRAGQGLPECLPNLESRIQGTLEVACSAGEGAPYRFHVDLVRREVRGLDERTRALIDQVRRPVTGAGGQ